MLRDGGLRAGSGSRPAPFCCCDGSSPVSVSVAEPGSLIEAS
ncbi:hypothetical protein O981_16930 [Mycobacterium avium 10-5560]|nr:hypothetical protein O981_16930 [Mycobacterium avium 10-5560]